jgi:acyl CoA:acetate/3-ketoacid CoA transferase
MADPSGGTRRGIGRAEQRDKVVPLADAAALVRDGDTICTSGFVGIGTPDALLAGIEQRFLECGEPRASPSSSPPARATARSRASTGSATRGCSSASSAATGG